MDTHSVNGSKRRQAENRRPTPSASFAFEADVYRLWPSVSSVDTDSEVSGMLQLSSRSDEIWGKRDQGIAGVQ